MGFYIRKSVRVGPLRFNLSKSGIGVSTGIPGFRIGTGPRGTYVHMGQGGLYYRQTIPTASPNRAIDDRQPSPPSDDTHGPMSLIGSGCVSEMVDTNSAELLSEIERKRKRLVWWPVVLVAALIVSPLLFFVKLSLWFSIPITIILLLGVVAIHQYDQLKKSVVLMYDLDGPILDSYQKLYNAINELLECNAVWFVTAKGDVLDSRYHAGAEELLKRNRISVEYRDPPFVKTNISVPYLPFGQHAMYLLPDRVLVYASQGVGAVDYQALELAANEIRFIEEGEVPPDAKVVDHTWKYVNKDGGPDRRFNNNRQIPICQYEELRITSATGVREILQLSRIGVADSLRSALFETVRSIQNAKVAEDERRAIEANRKQVQITESVSKSPTSTTTSPSSTSKPTPEMLQTSLFDLLCCIMVADGRVSINERTAIQEVMTKIRSGWTGEECTSRIEAFLEEIKSRGYPFVLQRSLSRIPLFKKIGRESTLLNCIDIVAKANGKPSDKEVELCDRIRTLVGNEN
jgi:hypothetical protein